MRFGVNTFASHQTLFEPLAGLDLNCVCACAWVDGWVGVCVRACACAFGRVYVRAWAGACSHVSM